VKRAIGFALLGALRQAPQLPEFWSNNKGGGLKRQIEKREITKNKYSKKAETRQYNELVNSEAGCL
jgi:hypothetical protein